MERTLDFTLSALGSIYREDGKKKNQGPLIGLCWGSLTKKKKTNGEKNWVKRVKLYFEMLIEKCLDLQVRGQVGNWIYASGAHS